MANSKMESVEIARLEAEKMAALGEADTSPESLGKTALCEALGAVVVLLAQLRDGLVGEVARWAKDALPWFLGWLVSGKVAGAVLDGLISALRSWRDARCG